MTGYLYCGDPTGPTTRRLLLTKHPAGPHVSFTDTNGKVVCQEAPSASNKRDSYGVFGARTSVGPWETFTQAGSLITAWTGDVYVWVDLPK